MGSKTKTNYLVKFWGEKEVKAYTHEEAREQVQKMKNIKPEQGITTNTYFEAIGESILLNSYVIITLIVGLVYAWSMLGLLKYITTLSESDPTVYIIAIMVWVILLFRTIRFPETISRHFKNREWER